MLWVFDSAEPVCHSRYRGVPCCLPRRPIGSALELGDFGAHSHAYMPPVNALPPTSLWADASLGATADR